MKSKLLTVFVTIALFISMVGTGFGVWIFTAKNTEEETKSEVGITAVALSSGFKVSFVSTSLVIDQTSSISYTKEGKTVTMVGLGGIKLKIENTVNWTQGTLKDEDKLIFTIPYTVKCEITNTSPTSTDKYLGDYLYFSMVKTQKSEQESDKSKDGQTFGAENGNATLEVKIKQIVNIDFSTTTDASGTLTLVHYIIPYFSYKLGVVLTSALLQEINNALKNTKITFTFNLKE